MSIHWTNKNIPFCHGESIVEWDMKAANLSLIKYYQLANEGTIAKIEGMKKDPREVYVGKICRKNPEFASRLEQAFTDMVEFFIAQNDLDRDKDVISIKKDAVFVRNRPIRNNEFGPVLFRPKGNYSGFLKLPKYEFYWNPESLDVKGLDDGLLPLHQEGVLQLVRDVFYESKNWTELNRYLKEYAKFYKERELPFDAYREFNDNSKFTVNLGGNVLQMDMIDELMLKRVDISYNYINIYLEILKIIIGR